MENILIDESVIICKNIENMKNQIINYEIEIEKLKKNIRKSEKELWLKCDHEWEYDTCCNFDDRTKYFCKKCKLWRNQYMYR